MDKYKLNKIPDNEVNLLYNAHIERNQRVGCIGYMRMDFGHSGNEFHTSWCDFCADLKTQSFQDEFDGLINTLRTGILTDLYSLSTCCYNNPGMKLNDWKGEYYGFSIKTDKYAYYFRCTLIKDNYNLCCYAYERDKLEKCFPPPDNITGELKSTLENAARYIIETSARETSGGNYITYTGDVPEEIISPELFTKYMKSIAGIMEEYEAVADVIVDKDSIDVNMYLDYCPNYEPFAEELDDYPPDRKIEDPLHTRRVFVSENEKLKDAEEKYGKDSFEYEHIKNEMSLNLDKYAEVLGKVESELNNRGYMLKNGEHTAQDYLNDYIDNVDVHPLPTDNEKITEYIINREKCILSHPSDKPSLMDKVEKGKQKAAKQEQPDKLKNKKQEVLK